MSEYTVFERDLVAASGVARSAVSKKRREILIADADYGLVKNATAYTPQAALRLLTELGVGNPSTVLEMAVKGIPDEKSAPIIAEVVRRFNPNTTIMECQVEKTGEKILVKVRNNRMFEICQRIPVKKSLTNIWFLAAPQPRRRGLIPGFKETGI